MGVARFLPKHMGGECDRVDGGGVQLPMPGSPAALAQQAEIDQHDDSTEWRLLVRLEREGLLREGFTAQAARDRLDA